MFPSRLEIIPTDGIIDKVRAAVPVAATLTITCPPHHGIMPTVHTATQLSLLGYNTVPHLSARSIESRSRLAGMLRDFQSAGITEVFAITGDAPYAAGPYSSGAQLMEDIAEMSGGSITMGVAGYPEGHPRQDPSHVLDSLLEKQHLAANIVTQMCFSATRISGYIELLHREGIDLPIWAGVPGALSRDRLVLLAKKIGVGTSLRLLSRKGPLARRLLTSGTYSPQSLVSELSALRPGPTGIHLHSFNNFHPHSMTCGTAPIGSGQLIISAHDAQ